MKKFLRWMFVMGALAMLIRGTATTLRAQTKPRTIQGKVLVKFASPMESQLAGMRTSTKNGFLKTGLSGFDALSQKHKAYSMKRVFPYNPKKEEAHKRHGLHLWYELTIDPGVDVARASADFKALQDIDKAEPVHAKALIAPNAKFSVVTQVPANSLASAPNDPLFPLQWHYENDGTHGGISEADINLLEAWKTQTGKSNVIVSIHDLGVDVTHKDLVPNIWVNELEKNGKTGVDDDYNGYVDDINGYDFSGNTGKVPPGDHATHVAGTIAAVNNNGIGVCGIAGGDGVNGGVKVMSAKILNGQYDNIAASYVYAADNGAVISQNSWGYTSPDVVDQAVLDGIDYFIEEAGNYPGSPMRGGIVIFASGNSNSSARWYPGYYERVLSVSSLGRTNTKAYYSNFGNWVEVSAPGGDQWDRAEDGILSTLPGNQYGFFQGTSMACPHVSGIAALVVSQNGGTDYKASELWAALTTSTHDINQYNSDYVDLLGTGYIDAALALKKNEKKAPSRITDLTIKESGQDYLGLNWTASTDADDVKASRYEIIYAKESLDVAKRKNIKVLSLSSDADAGTEINFSITDLYSNTKYYAAAYSIDRWGNKSGISTIVSSATSDGPGVSLDKSSIDFVIDATKGTVAQDGFNIINSSSGELRWKGEVRQKYYSLDWNSMKYPKAPLKASTSAKVGMLRTAAKSLKLKAGTTGYNDSYQMRRMTYTSYGAYGAYMIGEEDLSIPNSAATKFTVTYEDGFNLTDINTLINHNKERGDAPAIIEIYRGDELDRKNLVYAAEFNGYTDFDAEYDIQLDQQLYFPAGTSFWIALHMPAGHKYPLGVNYADEDGTSKNCMISFDVGETWTPLNDAIQMTQFVWVQTATSYSAPLDQYITLSPAEGSVTGKDQGGVDIIADASKLINGEYHADVTVLNNDYSNSLARIPLSLVVSGQTPKLSSASILDFGGVFVGVSKTLSIDIQNVGYGNFMVSNSAVNNTDFEIVESPYKIGALGISSLKLKYTAHAAGNSNGVVTLTDGKGNSYAINVIGLGVNPSVISVTPASKSYSLALGAKSTGTFTIKNTGNYPLQYFMPKFSSGDGIDFVDDGINKFGYSYKTSMDVTSGLAYSWDDISTTGKDVSAFFKDVAKVFYPVDLGFDFPIFNKTTNRLMITRYGLLTLDDQVNVNGNLIQIGSEYSPYGFISALNHELSFNSGGKLFYQAKSGKFIIQYEDARSVYDDAQHITFQIVIYDNGNVVVNYKDLSTFSDDFKNYIEVAVEDPEKKYGYLISNYEKPLHVTSLSSVQLVSPGSALMSNLSSVEGTVAVGGSVNVNFDVTTDQLTEGQFWQNLTIVSNDPLHPVKTFSTLVNITSGGVIDVSVNRDTVNLGDIFIGDTNQDVIQVVNSGTKAVAIQSITSDHNYFQIITDALPLTVKPRTSAYITTKLRGTTADTFADKLHITFSNGAKKDVVIMAKVFNPPAIKIVYTAINDALNAGEIKQHTITVSNPGVSDLQVVPSGNAWAYFKDVQAGESAAGIQYPHNSYYATNNKNGSGPMYQWEEVKDTGTRLGGLSYDGITNEEAAIDLPFTFNFYGKPYTKIYANPKGILSFTAGQDIGLFTGSSTIPDPEGPDNFIAPFWSNGAYYGLDGAPYGIFYKVDKDVVTIEYYNMYNIFSMGDPFHTQVLIYSNGNIKFQYNLPGSWTAVNFGITGIENQDGSDGVRIAAWENFVADKVAVLFAPADRAIIAAGQTKDLTLVIDATTLVAGSYSDNVTIQSNVPGKNTTLLPVNLTVSGEAIANAPDSVSMGDLIVDPNSSDPTLFTKEFMISNSGSATLNITSLKLGDGTEATLTTEVYDSWFGYYYWTPAPTELSLAPKMSQKFRVEVTPSASNHLLRDTILIESNDTQAQIKIPVSGSVLLPPVMNINEFDFTFTAIDASYTNTGSFTIDNTEGQSPLKYTMTVSYHRHDNHTAASVKKTTTSKVIPDLESIAVASQATAGITSVDGYNRTLEYAESNEADRVVGFGFGGAFVAGTMFQADDKGFNLTHIQTSYASESLTQNAITLEIYSGTDIDNMTLLSTDEYEFDNLGANYKGNLNLELKTPQRMLPYETFFVVIKYPFGTGHPQGLSELNKTLKDHFFFNIDGVWTDLTMVGQFATDGYLVKALEKTFVDGSWLTLNSATTGAVKNGESATFNFNVFSKNLTSANAYATLDIKSNAPAKSSETIFINLHMNQAPQFDQAVYEYEVDEIDTVKVTLPVQDQEGDGMTISIADAPVGLTWVTTENGVAITYVPDYLSAHQQTITVKATDGGNRSSTKDITFHVFNVNRTPVVVSHADRQYDYGAAAEEVLTSSIIADPDTDDVLSVVASSSNTDVVEVLASADKIRIKPRKTGEAQITVTVTDNYGASVSTMIKVTVNVITGIVTPEFGSVKIYPNPASETLNIVLENSTHAAAVVIVDAQGNVLHEMTVDKQSKTIHADVTGLAPGLYLLKIQGNDAHFTYKFIKK